MPPETGTAKSRKWFRRLKYWQSGVLATRSQAWIEIEDASRAGGNLHDDGHGSTMTRRGRGVGILSSGASSIPAVDSNHAKMPISPADVLLKWCGRIQAAG